MNNKSIICIDPGHGGQDDGALGPTGLRECDVVLSIAHLLKSMLLADGIPCILTRETDTFVSLPARCDISNNAKATLFLSIHCNSAEKPASGIETWISPHTGSTFGETTQKALVAEFPASPNRGVKHGDFWVLNDTDAPAALAECEFIHTFAGEALLRDPKTQVRFARALHAAILKQTGFSTTAPESTEPQPAPEPQPALAPEFKQEFACMPTAEPDKRSGAVIAQLDPKAQARFVAFLLEAKGIAARYGVDYKLISGYRTWAEQDALYAQGRAKDGPIVTNARGGFSMHNFRIAADAGVFSTDGTYLDGGNRGQQMLAEKVHNAVGSIAGKHGLAWGGAWAAIHDTPHYQIDIGRATPTQTDRETFSRKGSIL